MMMIEKLLQSNEDPRDTFYNSIHPVAVQEIRYMIQCIKFLHDFDPPARLQGACNSADKAINRAEGMKLQVRGMRNQPNCTSHVEKRKHCKHPPPCVCGVCGVGGKVVCLQYIIKVISYIET